MNALVLSFVWSLYQLDVSRYRTPISADGSGLLQAKIELRIDLNGKAFHTPTLGLFFLPLLPTT